MSVRSLSTGRRPWFSIMMITNGAVAVRAGATGAAPAAGTPAPSAVSKAAAATTTLASLARNLFIRISPPTAPSCLVSMITDDYPPKTAREIVRDHEGPDGTVGPDSGHTLVASPRRRGRGTTPGERDTTVRNS